MLAFRLRGAGDGVNPTHASAVVAWRSSQPVPCPQSSLELRLYIYGLAHTGRKKSRARRKPDSLRYSTLLYTHEKSSEDERYAGLGPRCKGLLQPGHMGPIDTVIPKNDVPDTANTIKCLDRETLDLVLHGTDLVGQVRSLVGGDPRVLVSLCGLRIVCDWVIRTTRR